MNAKEVFSMCIAGKDYNKKTSITGGTIRSYIIHPYATYCEYFAPDTSKDKPTEFSKQLSEWGKEVERKYVEALQSGLSGETYFFNVDEFQKVLQDCFNGKQFIYNPPVFYLGEDLAGQIDLLTKDDQHPSFFGNYHYVIRLVRNINCELK